MAKPKLVAIPWTNYNGVGNCDCGNHTRLKYKIQNVVRYLCLECASKYYEIPSYND